MKFLDAYARLIVAVALSLAATVLGFLIPLALDALAGSLGLHRITEGTAVVLGFLLPMVMPLACFFALYMIVRPVLPRSGQAFAWHAGSLAIVAANLLFFFFMLAAPHEADLAASESSSEFLATLCWFGLLFCISSILGAGACYAYARFLAANGTEEK